MRDLNRKNIFNYFNVMMDPSVMHLQSLLTEQLI